MIASLLYNINGAQLKGLVAPISDIVSKILSGLNLRQLIRQLLLIPGWRTNRKIVVIESDDWGSIRMPSKDIFNYLRKKGYKPESDPYLKYDTLANRTDLSDLFEVLNSVKDKNGNPAIVTANTVMANPDFNRIRENEFSEYYYEPFTTTLSRYQNDSFAVWKEGFVAGIFMPQFHAREHLNVDQWMKGLKENDRFLREAFDLEMISISSLPSRMKYSYMESFDFFSTEEEDNKKSIVKEGLDLFEKIFGFRSKSFIASCYIWGKSLEKVLSENGIEFIQGMNNQIQPKLDGNSHRHRYNHRIFGETNGFGQINIVRNVFFEPSITGNKEVYDALARIGLAFKFKKPAVIGSHRVNYIKGIHSCNDNFGALRTLLKAIVKEWPDVEFFSTDQLGTLMKYAG